METTGRRLTNRGEDVAREGLSPDLPRAFDVGHAESPHVVVVGSCCCLVLFALRRQRIPLFPGLIPVRRV